MSDSLREAGLANLRADIARLGWTQADLARASGLSHHMISMMLGGRRHGTGETHAKIAEAMNADPGFYFPRTWVELERAECCMEGAS